MRALTLSLLVAASLTAFGCSSADTPSSSSGRRTTTSPPSSSGGGTTQDPGGQQQQPAPTGTEVGSETWSDGKQIASSVIIKAGATVEIAAGATVTVAADATITVEGTLVVKPGASHAKLTGTSWKGIVVAKGGTFTADGLDIAGASEAIATQTGNADATFTNGSIAGADTPFKMQAGSKLSISKSSVKATGPSEIAGTFTASYMDYDKGTAEGLELSDAAGSMTISDSTLHGNDGGDFVVSRKGALVKVEYTTIVGAHCGFHFDDVGQYSIDHVTDKTNSYGAMLYGSTGPNTIKSSNFGNDINLDMQGTNGPTTIDGVYFGKTGTNTLQPSATVKNTAQNEIADAKPR